MKISIPIHFHPSGVFGFDAVYLPNDEIIDLFKYRKENAFHVLPRIESRDHMGFEPGQLQITIYETYRTHIFSVSHRHFEIGITAWVIWVEFSFHRILEITHGLFEPPLSQG